MPSSSRIRLRCFLRRITNCVASSASVPALHKPPYNREIDHNLDLTNFRESLIFRESEFSPPNGVWAVWMVSAASGDDRFLTRFHFWSNHPKHAFPYTCRATPSVTTCFGTPTSGAPTCHRSPTN